MVKLLVCDKDGTLTKPASGATFVQHPKDQVLIEGVAEAIDRYHKAGWAIVIASNQGGCAKQTIAVESVKPGMYWHSLGKAYRIREIRSPHPGYSTFVFEDEDVEGVGNTRDFPDDAIVCVSWKTLESAIEEMRYCMKLIYPLLSWPQSLYFRGLLCPDFSGETCWAVNSFSEQGNWKAYEVSEPIRGAKIGYRKPQSGMIKEAIDYLEFSGLKVEEILFVGDRPEDQQAAEAANVRFLWAEDWLRSNP